MQPDWNELARKEVETERERLARNKTSDRVAATLFVGVPLVIYLGIKGVQWFLGHPTPMKEVGWPLGMGIVWWVMWTEGPSLERRRNARELRLIRIEEKLDRILSTQDKA